MSRSISISGQQDSTRSSYTMRKILFFLFHVLVANSWASKMVLRDNGYEGVLFAIHPDVPENPNILTEIQSLIASASPYLHQAMRGRAYFKAITILIPNTWKDLPEYEDVTIERFQDADFRIQEPNPSYGNNPYTRQPRGCGEPGNYIHVTPDYVLDNGIERERNWGDPGRVLVHEFAHLRYGVFDEYGFDDSDEFPLFYINDNGRTQVTGCTEDVRGVVRRGETMELCVVDPETRLPAKGCRFFADPINNKAKASVMFLQFVQSVDSFCEVDSVDPSLTHNRDAPNLQNKMCNGLGTWDVISKHVDFINGDNPPVPYPADAVLNVKLAYPKLTVPASGSSRVVLVMDISGSMDNRIFRLGQTASKLIYDIIPDQYHLGMVVFHDYGQQWRPIVTIANQATRAEEANGLPTSDDLLGSTSIGGGIDAAIQMLRNDVDDQEGSTLILITDGRGNKSPYIADVIEDVKSSGIIVHSMAYGIGASDNIPKLSAETGGQYQFYAESSVSTALDAFLEQIEAVLVPDDYVLPSTVLRELVTLKFTDPVATDSVVIDSSLGHQTEFFFTCPEHSTVEVTVTGPSSQYTRASPEYTEDLKFKVIRIKLPTAEPGTWTYTVSRQMGFDDEYVAVYIRSRPPPNETPITIKAYMNTVEVSFPAKTAIYAEVTRGSSPVLGASVAATIERPQEVPVNIPLFDNGQGADTVRDDGIYSAYFTQFSGDGKYSVDVLVENPGTASIVAHQTLPGGAYSILKPNPKPNMTLLDPFTRMGTAGGFVVTAFVLEDIIPPSRITDLLVRAFDFDNMQVTLQWTAPGDNFDTGRGFVDPIGTIGYKVTYNVMKQFDCIEVKDRKADHFELRYGRSYESVRTDFQNMTLLDDAFLLSGNLTPPFAGNKVSVTVRTPPFTSSDVMVFGVRAIDDTDNVGDLSNLVAIARQPDDEVDETGRFILDQGEPVAPTENQTTKYENSDPQTTKIPDPQTTKIPDPQTTKIPDPRTTDPNSSSDSLAPVYIQVIGCCCLIAVSAVFAV